MFELEYDDENFSVKNNIITCTRILYQLTIPVCKVLCYFLIRMYMAVKHVRKPSHFLLMVSGRGCSEFLAKESLLRRLITF
jgi:hypothetical protein